MTEKLSKITILDGGLGTELGRMGFSMTGDPLWSARMLHENPEAIVDVHKKYLMNGAEIITTSSYQANLDGFREHLGVSLEESKKLLMLSVELAKKAREEYLQTTNGTKEILIAGSIGPYAVHLADGSEYTGEYCDQMSHQELIEWHKPRIECLLEGGADILAFETIPAVKEAEALMRLLCDYPQAKAWLSFSSLSKNKTCHGDDIGAAVSACRKMVPPRQLIAAGINCCPPEYAGSLLSEIKNSCPGLDLIVYPNSGEIWEHSTGWSGKRTWSNHEYLNEWVRNSAKYIGGCCRTTPEDIFAISQFINKNYS